MNLTNLTIKDLIKEDTELTFLVGAGCSVDAPSCLPDGRSMIEILIEYFCVESEVEKILKLPGLRFEHLIEIIRDMFDLNLKIIDYYGQCDKPNLQHFFLAEMIKKGFFVLTTNFDFLIEYALLQSGVPKKKIIPVITKHDFEKYSNPNNLFKKKMKTVYKIHGSTKNVITGEDTRKSLVTTIHAFGKNKEGENMFQVEPFKRPLFDNISNNRTLVVMGYSGSDDFDIIPTLKVLKSLKNIIWINYIQEDYGIERIYEINNSIFQEIKNSDKINKILADIYRMRNVDHIYRVDGNTSRLIAELLTYQPNLSSNLFYISPMTWLKKNFTVSNEYKYLISFRIYHDFDIFDDAMKCCRKILEIAEKKSNKDWKSLALNKIARILYIRGEMEEALKYYREALAIDEQLGNLYGKASLLSQIGDILHRRGEMEEALRYYREALAIDEQLGDLEGKANRLNNIGWILYGSGKLEEALKYYREALAIAQQLGDLHGKVRFLNTMGQLLETRGEIEEALKYYREALLIAEHLSDLDGKGIILNSIGLLLAARGESEEALKHYREALAIFEQLDNLEGKATLLNSIALLLAARGESEGALKYYQQALAIDEQLGNLYGKASRLNNIGEIFRWRGELEEALKYYQEALLIVDQLGNLLGKVSLLNNIGEIFRGRGELEVALKYYREALLIAEHLSDLNGKAIILNNIGHILYGRGELEEALKYYQEALAIAEHLKSPYVKIIKNEIEILKNKIRKE